MKRLLTALVALPLVLLAILRLPPEWFTLFVMLLVAAVVVTSPRVVSLVPRDLPFKVPGAAQIKRIHAAAGRLGHPKPLALGALLPAIVGMVAGQRIRQSLSEQLFRRIFFVSLLALGAYIIISAFSGFK